MQSAEVHIFDFHPTLFHRSQYRWHIHYLSSLDSIQISMQTYTDFYNTTRTNPLQTGWRYSCFRNQVSTWYLHSTTMLNDDVLSPYWQPSHGHHSTCLPFIYLSSTNSNLSPIVNSMPPLTSFCPGSAHHFSPHRHTSFDYSCRDQRVVTPADYYCYSTETISVCIGLSDRVLTPDSGNAETLPGPVSMR